MTPATPSGTQPGVCDGESGHGQEIVDRLCMPVTGP